MNAAIQKSWLQRNGVAVLVVGAILALSCAGVVWIFSLFRSSDAYTLAVAAARSDSRVSERLGTPIEEGFFTTGSIHVNGGGSGNASLKIPLSGPKASGTLYAVARRDAGEWKLTRLVFEDADAKRVELIAPRGAAATDSSGN